MNSPKSRIGWKVLSMLLPKARDVVAEVISMADMALLNAQPIRRSIGVAAGSIANDCFHASV